MWLDDRGPDGQRLQIFQGYDGVIPVGSVQAITGGPMRGKWMWSGHGPHVRERILPHQGYMPTGREACQMAEDYYHRLMRHNGKRGSRDFD